MFSKKTLTQAVAIAIASGTLAACGGGGSGGGTDDGTSATTARTVVGTVDGFGSIYVNGIKFETEGTTYRVDDDDNDLEDDAGDDSALRVGMKVRVRGEVDDNSRTGRADSVYYDDDIEGPIENVTPGAETVSFTIFGLPVIANASTAFDSGADLASLANGQVFEVSGYFDGTSLVATFMDPQDAFENEYEVKGTVTAYDGTQVSIELINGASLDNLPIPASAIIEVSAPVVGQFVEIKLDTSGNVVKIETEDDLLDDDDNGFQVEIRGVLADGTTTDFEIGGIPLVLTDRTEYDPPSLEGTLAAGMEVKVEGFKDGNSLIVTEVEREEGEIEIDGVVQSVTASGPKTGTIVVNVGAGTLTVSLDTDAMYKDSSDFDTDDDGSFDLTELGDGEFVEIEASGTAGSLTATSIEREGNDIGDSRVEAPVDGWDEGVSITLLGLTWDIASGSGGTDYEIEDVPTTQGPFFNELENLGVGAIVKVKDDATADGIADELDLDLPSP